MMPLFLDTFLIAPFRAFPSPMTGFWIGCALLALWCVLLGRITQALLEYAGRSYYARLDGELRHSHDLSMKALRAGDKQSYLAINSMAHERFGKQFFARAALGMGSLWPAPFALWWLSLRFEGVELFTPPFMSGPAGYPFVFILLYIVERIAYGCLERRVTRKKTPLRSPEGE